MARDPKNAWAPAAWPALLSLGLLTALIAGMFAISLVLARRVATEADDLIENSVRSTELLDDIRGHVRRLAADRRDPRDIAALTAAIERDARAYAPLATAEGEGEGWRRLEAQLATLSRNLSAPPGVRIEIKDDIGRSVDRLIAINQDAARTNAITIRDAHRRALRADVAVGGMTLVLVTAIGIMLLRVLARQRRLVAERVRMLDEQNSELEAFAGRAAHDLRSPLNPIRGYADLILENNGSSEDNAAMALRIRKGVDRMARVVDDMLALSTSGRPPPGKAPIAAVVAAVVEEMGPELRDVELVTKLTGDDVACQEGILGQILRNLIGNAIKFRARSRPLEIVLETRSLGTMVEIAIQDNGVGMDPTSAKQAFEPFFRGQGGREMPGHGLGLAIVERTTRALGGTSELSSVQDQGTRIAIRLPRA